MWCAFGSCAPRSSVDRGEVARAISAQPTDALPFGILGSGGAETLLVAQAEHLRGYSVFGVRESLAQTS
jgi:hypothetical protein